MEDILNGTASADNAEEAVSEELGEAVDEAAQDIVEEVNEPVDGKAIVDIRHDDLEAYLTISAPQYGGKNVTLDEAYAEIAKQGVVFGLDDEAIEQLVTHKDYEIRAVIATGARPEKGDDGYVKLYYPTERKLVPKENEDGSVDFRDLGLVINIQKGDVICDIVYQTEGKPGKTVRGVEIPAQPGKPPVIPKGNNTGLNSDQSKLVALAAGNLVYSKKTFNVEPSLVIRGDICHSTGNINFVGDVVINGNVLENFKVESGKTITVNGSVNGASLIASGEIKVRTGVFNSTISTTDAVTVGFAENSNITCKRFMKASSLVSCKVNVEGDLECLTRPGAIIGGAYYVVGNVAANSIGYKTYLKTKLIMGNIAMLADEKALLEKKVEKIDDEINQINLSVSYLQQKKKTLGRLDQKMEDYLNSIIRSRVQKNMEKNPILRRIQDIERKIKGSEKITITVKQSLYPNVKIFLANYVLVTEQEYGRAFIYADTDGIKIGV